MAKKNTKRGFTLVELIVVLVILAILAALLIPALTGYIDKARKSQVVAETRMLTQAVQTEMSTLYASNEYATIHIPQDNCIHDDISPILKIIDSYYL